MPALPEDLRKFATLDFAARLGAFGVTAGLGAAAAYYGFDQSLSKELLAAAALAGNVFGNLATDFLKGCVDRARTDPHRNYFQEEALRNAIRTALKGSSHDTFSPWFKAWETRLSSNDPAHLRGLFEILAPEDCIGLARDPSGWWPLAELALARWAAEARQALMIDPLPLKLAAHLRATLPARVEAEFRHELQTKPEAFRGHALDYFQHLTRLAESNDHRTAEMLRLLREIVGLLESRQAPAGPPPIREFLGKLPVVDSTVIGRDPELAFLDAAWADPAVNFVQIIAPGGTGKTALVDKWFRRHLGEATVFGWSFYSQGTAENRQTSSDPFFDEIVRWFPIPVPEGASVFGKAAAVARRLREERVLLILDGVEPLQEPNGELRDKPLHALFQELRAHNAGMVLCSTRVRLTDVPDGDAAKSRDLDNLAPADGAQYLRALGVEGSLAELEEASREYGNHALALTLLGTYIADQGGSITARHEIRALPLPEDRQGRHARRVMQRYFELFHGKPEGALLRALGYFDRPAEPDALRLVLPHGRVDRKALRVLHKARLILTADPESAIDCHPLVREHFAAVMRETAEAEFRAGHSRLYEHYAKRGKRLPDTREEMKPLFYAIYHGCQAGRHAEVRREVYRDRVLRGRGFYLVNKLGAFGTDLSLLANFFADPWSCPVAGLSAADQSWLIGQAGFALRAVGRLADAVEPIRVSAGTAVACEDWKNAARGYSNLSELLLTLGRVPDAVVAARQSVELSDISGDAEERTLNRAALADALHDSGDLAGAAALFVEAEKIQAEVQPQYSILYSFQGYKCCDLLLARGEADEARRRATQTLQWAEQLGSLLDIALDHLTRARAGDPTHFTPAIEGFRHAGRLDHLPRGLLARATPADLEEVHRIATRSGMKLHLTDYHLKMARLHSSREHLDQAAKLIAETGYHRRDAELAELRKLLGDA
ncbi:MAG: hypothetical protein R2729_24120 [Bryobacteraceae bacterium]